MLPTSERREPGIVRSIPQPGAQNAKVAKTKKTRIQISFVVYLQLAADSHTAPRAASSTRSHLTVIRRCPGPSQTISLAMPTARLLPGRLLRTQDVASGLAANQLAGASYLDFSRRPLGCLKARHLRKRFCGRRFMMETYVGN